MPQNEYELTARAQAIQNFLAGFSSEALRDLGPHLNCYECEVLADVFLTHGLRDHLDALMAGHLSAEEEGDREEHLEIKRQLKASQENGKAKPQSKPRRRCKRCGKPERIRTIGGFRYSNITPHLGLCAACIKAAMKS